MRYELRHPFMEVEGDGQTTSGGSQRRGRPEHMRRWGCGVFGAADFLFYMSLYHRGYKVGLFADAPADGHVTLDWYNDRIDRLRRGYLPVLPHHGINGLGLAMGLNAYFRKYDLPLRARWGVLPKNFWQEIDHQLQMDRPVIISVGNNFPKVWEKNKLNFYSDPDYTIGKPIARTMAHYVTVTGSDPEWLRISSWGKQYYINKAEYCAFIDQYSSHVLSNMLYIREVQKGE